MIKNKKIVSTATATAKAGATATATGIKRTVHAAPAPVVVEDNTIFADNHTLFIEEQPMRMEPLRDEEGSIVEGFFEQTGGVTIYKLFIGDFDESGSGIQRIINALQNSQPEDILEIHISSHGGLVSELIELYNLIDSMFYERVTTFCNFGYSAGALSFLFGDDRVIYEHSDWMMHSYSGGYIGKRDDMIKQLKHDDTRINKFFDEVLEPYFTPKELKKMRDGEDFWQNAEKMLKRNIATHIMVAGEILTAQEWLEDKYPKRKVKRLKQEAKEAEKEAKEAKKAAKAAKAEKTKEAKKAEKAEKAEKETLVTE